MASCDLSLHVGHPIRRSVQVILSVTWSATSNSSRTASSFSSGCSKRMVSRRAVSATGPAHGSRLCTKRVTIRSPSIRVSSGTKMKWKRFFWRTASLTRCQDGIVLHDEKGSERLSTISGKVSERRLSHGLPHNKAKKAEPADAPNPAMTPQFQSERHRRGVGDPWRSASAYARRRSISRDHRQGDQRQRWERGARHARRPPVGRIRGARC